MHAQGQIFCVRDSFVIPMWNLKCTRRRHTQSDPKAGLNFKSKFHCTNHDEFCKSLLKCTSHSDFCESLLTTLGLWWLFAVVILHCQLFYLLVPVVEDGREYKSCHENLSWLQLLKYSPSVAMQRMNRHGLSNPWGWNNAMGNLQNAAESKTDTDTDECKGPRKELKLLPQPKTLTNGKKRLNQNYET